MLVTGSNLDESRLAIKLAEEHSASDILFRCNIYTYNL